MRKFLFETTRIVFMAEDGGGGGAPGGGGEGGGSAAPANIGSVPGVVTGESGPAPKDPHAGVPATAPTDKPTDAPVRPDYIPEKFWDKEKNAPHVEQLAKSYADLERKIHTRTDDLRKGLTDEVKASLMKDRPAKLEDYQFAPSKGFLPDGLEFQGNPESPVWKALSNIAYERGLSQNDVSQIVDAYLMSMAETVPDPVAEMKQLGANANERVEKTKLWAQANVPKEFLTLIGTQVATTAAGVKMLEWMMNAMGEPRQGDLSISGTAGGNGKLTAQQLTQMQNDPRYFDAAKRDPSYVARIEAGWRALAAG